MRRLLLLLIFVLPAFNQLHAQFGFSLTGNRTEVTIPFEIQNNLIVIPVVLNNAIPLKFILDTGVRTAILTEKTISDLMEISYDRKISIIGGGGGDTVDAYIAHNVTLHLPGVRGSGQPLLILAKDYLNLKNTMGLSVHGILGYEIFGRFVVKIDYINRIITLTEPATFKPRRRDTAIPLHVEDTKPYVYIDLQISDSETIKAKMMIDTGASHSILLDAASNEQIEIPEEVIPGKLGKGLTGDIEGFLARVDRITVDEYEFKNIITSFPDEISYRSIRENTNRNGTIGSGLLSRFYVTYDYFNQVMYLKKNKKYRAPFEYNMSGLDFEALAPMYNEYVVSYVREGSPADKAGVQVGDRLLMINGYLPQNIKLGDIFTLLTSKAGKTVRMKLDRNGELIQVKFELDRLI